MSREDPAQETSRSAGLRDVLAGAAILALGLVTGGSSVFPDRDGVDVAFDVLGGVWIAWGLVRLLRSARAKGAAQSPGSSGPKT